MTTETSRQIDLTAVSRLVLRHGRSIPRLGLGTWPMLGEECENAVRHALLAGYRLFDTAFAYRNEEAIGRALKDAGVPRGELFISSKFNKEFHSVGGVQRAYDDSLRRLGLDYLDMLVCHGPVPAQDENAEAWKGLVRLLQQGRVKAIGVSNFKPAHLAKIIDATGVVPGVNQIQLSPGLACLQPRALHEELGILTQSWSPSAGNRACARIPPSPASPPATTRAPPRSCSAGTSNRASYPFPRPQPPSGSEKTSPSSTSHSPLPRCRP